jgi:AI-2E family transporter
MAGVIGALVLGTYSLREQMQTIIEELPEAATKFATGLARMQIGQTGNIQKMQSAATEVEKATTQAAVGSVAPRQPATHVIVDRPTFKLSNFLWESSMGALGVISQAAMVVFLVFFLLLGGDTFKRKLVRLTGLSLSKRKITVHILDDINGSIQKYMFMLLTTNLLVALLAWIAFHWIGLDNAAAWAAAAGLLHIAPYLGPAVTAAANGNGCLHAIRIVFNGAAGCRRVAGDRYHRRHVRDHLDDRTNRQHEFSGSVHFPAVLGLAVGGCGGCCSAFPSSSSSRSCRSMWSSCTRWPNCWRIDSFGGDLARWRGSQVARWRSKIVRVTDRTRCAVIAALPRSKIETGQRNW